MPEWTGYLHHCVMRHNGGVENPARSVADVVDAASARLREGRPATGRPAATGFDLLDTYLGGGFRPGELILLGGPQGLGKTTFALQVARNVASAGGNAVYFSYEHDEIYLLERLISMEAGEALGIEGIPVKKVRQVLEAADGGSADLDQRLAAIPGGADAMTQIRRYADRLHVVPASGATTDLAAIRQVLTDVAARSEDPPLSIVDYLQKVPVPDGPEIEAERVTLVVEGLKDLALELGLPVFAIVAAEKEGLTAGKRLRVHHLRGTSALAYEPDVVLVLNDKFDVVARHHLVFDVGNAERFRSWVVLSIEKNRSGLDKIDLEFRKRFDQSRFEQAGQAVEEQLVDERVFVE
jgi:replicative DNA helicase